MSTAPETNTRRDTPPAPAGGLEGEEVGRVWDLCLKAEFDHDELLQGIAEWLGPPEGLSVLDCACGTGFPAIELHRRGYRMSCTDGSASMLERFRQHARDVGVSLQPQQVRWEELGGLFAESFDVVMCRGCSLIYAGTWDTDAEPDSSTLVSAVENFVRCLRPGGRLYIDTTREEELLGEYPQVEEHAPRIVDGHTVAWQERITADPQTRVRNWQVSLYIDDATISFERKSHYLPHADFIRMLSDAGLEQVSRVEVPGERYAVFVGRRTAT